MKRTRRPAREAKQPADREREAAAPTPGLPPARPFARRPRLFMALLVVFVAWVAVLLTMYFTTVYPGRHPSAGAATRPGASGLPSAPR